MITSCLSAAPFCAHHYDYHRLNLRIPWLQAVKAGVTVGIGFVGMGLVIVMAIDSLSPPIKVMIERFGLTLHVFDVGAGPASGVGYATAIGAMIIPVIFLLNVGMLVTRLTKTMNVDIYNYWHYAITGTVVQLMTGSLIYGVLGAICHAALSLKWPTGRRNEYRTLWVWKGFLFRKGMAPVPCRCSYCWMRYTKKYRL